MNFFKLIQEDKYERINKDTYNIYRNGYKVTYKRELDNWNIIITILINDIRFHVEQNITPEIKKFWKEMTNLYIQRESYRKDSERLEHIQAAKELLFKD